jgi:hypothetical protein
MRDNSEVRETIWKRIMVAGLVLMRFPSTSGGNKRNRLRPSVEVVVIEAVEGRTPD